MPKKQRREDALALLRGELVVGRATTAESTTRAAWLAWVRFAQLRFGAVPTPESDGLLFQYGTYAFTGRPMFTLDLTRQFGVNDDDGEHDHYVQVHCELRFEPEPALDAAGSFDSWFFHDSDADLDQWFAAMEKRLELVGGRGPFEIELYEELV
ncbi:hypothetical protein ACFVX6_14210 [Streptomyces sp. NPDC058289]|uniref:hypothetical protein n=1 Tax=Streptomyces sp. NPDC058289 TaxID=3346425 RepID=UPI0036E6E99F